MRIFKVVQELESPLAPLKPPLAEAQLFQNNVMIIDIEKTLTAYLFDEIDSKRIYNFIGLNGYIISLD